MPRYRKLHTKTVYSLDVNDMPDDFTRLFWVLMPVGLSREGTSHDHPAYVKSRIFPLRDDVTYEMIGAALDWFADHDMIQRYQVDKRLYFHQVNFAKYQGNTTKEAESDFPPVPTEVVHNSRPTPELIQTKSSTDAVCSIQYSDSNADTDTAPNGAKPKPEREDQQYWAVLVDVCHIKRKTEKLRGRLNMLIKWLRSEGYTMGDVKTFALWWESDPWRKEHTPMALKHYENSDFGAWVDNGRPTKATSRTPPANDSHAAIDRAVERVKARQANDT